MSENPVPPPQDLQSAPDAADQTRALLSSLTLKGAVAMAIAYAAGRFGMHLPEGLASTAAQTVIDLVFALGLAAVGIGRARAKTPLH